MAADVRVPPWSPQEFELNETTMHREFDLPPEAALDGRPEGGDLLLQRTLGRVRHEKAREGRRRQSFAVVVSTSLLAAALAGGVVIGRHLTGDSDEFVVGAISNGASISAVVSPAEGWSRLRVNVKGVRAGERCWLVVTDVHGGRFVVGSWIAGTGEPGRGVTLDGAALVAADDLEAVNVETLDGHVLVSAPH
ncbi:anti-sigma factor [Umezawaea endophytica]|uniref:Anti-sigma factor n=1 Tax=Umezawaea endophytica TaxID=1654476 RepID=A0A9X2VTH1_9PSEU|nr:anti-sigma factor [Umezawaea endophytica]MCS7481839.1 anti-sigma factor [Umezawaea endophytica]